MRIGWVSAGAVDERNGEFVSGVASIRLRLLGPLRRLAARGHEVHLLQLDRAPLEHCAERLAGLDAVVFKKSIDGERFVIDLFERALSLGVPTIFDLCDLRLDPGSETGRINLRMLGAADRVVASTPELAAILRAETGRDIGIVTDPYEGPRADPVFDPRRERLKALWFGHPSNLDTLHGLLGGLVQVGRRWPIELTLLTGRVPELAGLCKSFNQQWRHALATRYEEWTLERLWSALAETDVVVIPSLPDAPDKAVKSPNRMVESLWAGRAVVANPLPAYLPFADWAFIDESIAAGLSRLLDDPSGAPERIRAAQGYIAETHDPERIADAWEREIAAAASARRERGTGRAAQRPLRLNLGCGDKLLQGYVNVDVARSRAGKEPDVVCDLRSLSPFDSDGADEVLAVHVIEHFWRWEALDVLREWTRVLRPGGTMVLECPNLATACEAFLADPAGRSGPGREGQTTMWVFYGDPAWRDPLMIHRWGYTPDSLARLMREAGLVNVRQEPAQYKLREPRDMRIVGEKPAGWTGPAAPRTPGPPVVEAGQGYLRWYYDTEVWKQVSYRGVRTLKSPSDMWNYQEIIAARNVQWVVETGSRHGGSALFFADLLTACKASGGVISIDISLSDLQVADDTRIRFVQGDSAAPEVVRAVAGMLPAERGPLLLLLDSDHARDHVLRELEAWVPLLRPGDYLVVEDTCVNGHPVRPDFGPGPYEAVEAFLEAHPGMLEHDAEREGKFGHTFAPLGYFVRR
jgi:cephalosporin hydroxylase